jgi:hypothetical protein
MWYR